VKELRTLKAADVARLLQGVSRQHQAQIALALQGSPSVAAVLRELEGPKLDALLAELDSEDRRRLLALVNEES
jgi:Mg/Co/Ni transporter MgtE